MKFDGIVIGVLHGEKTLPGILQHLDYLTAGIKTVEDVVQVPVHVPIASAGSGSIGFMCQPAVLKVDAVTRKINSMVHPPTIGLASIMISSHQNFTAVQSS
ncbi:MAG: hypothetical protein OK457_00515 [Thaumarchaeota archaeon]|nr:hypothetical protein [Nitrososphaerota archaeon]